MPIASASRDDDARPLGRRNRRTALALLAWIALLIVASVIVIWVRN